MLTFLDLVLKYWPLLLFVGAGLVHLGVLHQMVTNSNRAMARLFKDIEILNKHVSQQQIINQNIEKMSEKADKTILDHVKESAERYSDLSARIDGIFNLLSQKSNK